MLREQENDNNNDNIGKSAEWVGCHISGRGSSISQQ